MNIKKFFNTAKEFIKAATEQNLLVNNIIDAVHNNDMNQAKYQARILLEKAFYAEHRLLAVSVINSKDTREVTSILEATYIDNQSSLLSRGYSADIVRERLQI